MNIRKAEEKDIPRLLALLGQVLQIHAEIRPDIFIPGTTKYTWVYSVISHSGKRKSSIAYYITNSGNFCGKMKFVAL